LIVELVRRQRAHEGHRRKQIAGFQVVCPCVMDLSLGFELAATLDKPVAIMPSDLRRLSIEAAKLPVCALLLHNKRQSVRALAARNIQDYDAVIPRYQVREHENSTAGGLAALSKDSAEKLCARDRRRTLCLEQEWRTWCSGRTSKVGL